mgnify:CR=1 FL=1
MDEVARRQRAKRIGGAIGGILVGVLMALFLHPEGLSQQGCYVLAILAGSIVWWICGVLPEFATALIMVMLFALVGGIPAVTSFSFFSNPIWWLLVGAFSIGLGMVSRGEVALIVAQKGEQAGLIDPHMFPPIVLVVIVTTLVTPILLKLGMSKQTPANTEFNAQEKVQMPKVSQH